LGLLSAAAPFPLCGGLPQTGLTAVVSVVPPRSYGVFGWRWAVMTRVAASVERHEAPWFADKSAVVALETTSRRRTPGLLLRNEGLTDGVVDETVH
jgi:hypothetical protein